MLFTKFPESFLHSKEGLGSFSRGNKNVIQLVINNWIKNYE